MEIHYVPGDAAVVRGDPSGDRRVFTARELGQILGAGKPVELATPGGGGHPVFEVTQTDNRFVILVGN
jgi:hypothetical protein